MIRGFSTAGDIKLFGGGNIHVIGRHAPTTDTSFVLNFSLFTATDDTDLHDNNVPSKEESTDETLLSSFRGWTKQGQKSSY